MTEPLERDPLPLIGDGPGWARLYGGDVMGSEDEDALVDLSLDWRRDHHRAALVLGAVTADTSEPVTVAVELTLEDLAALAARACEIGSIAATEDEAHFTAEAFDRAREQLDRLLAR